jgi:hypothetical protein
VIGRLSRRADIVVTFGRWLHLGAAWLFALGVVVQGYLAGQGLPQLGGTSGFEAHISFGYTVMGILALAVLIGALVGRVPRRQAGLAVALLVLYVVQTSLPHAKASMPALAALHPANAMLLLLLAIYVAIRARRLVAREAPAPQPL